MTLDSLELARHVVELIAEKQGEDVLLLDIRNVSILTDYFVIASALSARQTKAMMADIKQDVKQTLDVRPLLVEGEPSSGWVLMDYGDVVVHLFAPDVRAYYNLEELWQDGRIVVRML